jgi:hypothetical protein
MSAYNSSDTFQELNSTESNGYNVFPAAYMSTGVGGSRRKNKSLKNKKDKKKGGECGCSKNQSQNQSQQGSFKLFGGKRQNKASKKNKKNKTKKAKW